MTQNLLHQIFTQRLQEIASIVFKDGSVYTLPATSQQNIIQAVPAVNSAVSNTPPPSPPSIDELNPAITPKNERERKIFNSLTKLAELYEKREENHAMGFLTDELKLKLIRAKPKTKEDVFAIADLSDTQIKRYGNGIFKTIKGEPPEEIALPRGARRQSRRQPR